MGSRRHAGALLLVAMAVLSQPSDASPDGVEKTVGDLAVANQETLWFQAQTLRAKARKEYLETSQTSDRTMDGAPEARGVQGVGTKLRAEFVYPSGAVTYAKAGDTLPGGYKVERISVEELVISKDGTRQTLSLASGELRSQWSSQAEPPRPASVQGFAPPRPIPQVK